MAIRQLLLSKVYINDKSREGKEFITEKGKKFWKIAVQDEKEYGNEYLSDLIFDEDDIRFNWKPGQQVNVVVEKKGQYLNFKMPDKFDYLEARVEALEEFIRTPDERMVKHATLNELEKDIEAEDEIKVSDLPF